jgi:hypothetical protein
MRRCGWTVRKRAVLELLRTVGQVAIRVSGLVGALVALVGTLYMAYDLFGQRHGLLRLLTETITYVIIGVVFGTLALGFIALDAVLVDPYFVPVVTLPGAVSVLLTWGAGGGLGAGLTYVVTIERKWNAGQPKSRKDRPVLRIAMGLAIGIFVGCVAYVVMANFRHTHGILSGLYWGTLQGIPTGLVFGLLVALFLVHFDPQPLDVTDPEHSDTRTGRSVPFDTVGFLSGIATGISVGPMTSISYFALYGPIVPKTFANISIAGIIGGLGLGLALGTVERTLIWIDRLPPKRLGVAGALLVILGFLFQAVQQVSQLAPSLPLGK